MTTLLANAAVIFVATLLVCSPGLLWFSFGQHAQLTIAAGAASSLLLLVAATFVAAWFGLGTIVVSRSVGVILLCTLAWSVVRLLRRNRRGALDYRRAAPYVPLALGVGVAMAALAPPLLVLHEQGLVFGLVNLGNADQSNYVLVTQNLMMSGFDDAHRVGNADLGLFARQTYIGCYALISFLASMLGLTPLEAAMPALGVAISLASISLWSLARTLWPGRPHAVVLATVVGMCAALSTYTYSMYFLGAVLGFAAIVTLGAGVIEGARSRGAVAFVCIVAGGGFGIYTYGHMVLPVVVLSPVAGVLVGVALRAPARALWSIARWTLAAGALAMVSALPALPTAYNLAMSQSQVQAGWSLPAIDVVAAVVWPPSIAAPQSDVFAIGGWLCLAIGALVALRVASKRSPGQHATTLTGLVALACALVVGVCVWVYGAERYQTWKMLSFLLPIALVAVLPAINRTLLAATAGATVLGSWLLWSPMLTTPTPTLLTTADMMAVRNDERMSQVSTINIRLPDVVETMTMGALLDDKTVVFTQNSYYAALTSMNTCTLTTRSLLAPDEQDFAEIVGDFVILNRPSTCTLTN